MNDDLLRAVQERQEKLTEFGYGILTADRYVRNIQDAIGLDKCYQLAATRTTSWDDVMRKAARTLVYSNPDMVTEEVEYSKRAGSSLKELDGIELPKNTLMVFRHVLTTPRKDRDGDVLRTQGAKIDPKMLLLWNHVHTIPVGKMLQVAEHNSKKLSLVSCIVDELPMAHDCAVMIDNGMGRFSHGFRAIEFTKIKARDGAESGGFDVKDFEIMEASLVSVPSNTDAEVEEVMLGLVEGGKLTSPMMKEFGRSIREHRPKQFSGMDLSKVVLPVDLKITLNGKEISHEDLEGAGAETGSGAAGEGKDAAGLAEKADGGTGKAEEATTDEKVKCPECGAMMSRSAGAECPKCGYVLKKSDVEDEEEDEPEEEKSGRVFSGENFTSIKGVHGDVRELNKGQHVRDKSGIEMCKRSDKRLKSLIKEYDIPIGKSARSISAKNLTELKEIHGDLKDIDEGDHVITDKGRPIAHRAAKTLGGLVTKYDMAESEQGKSFGVEDAMAVLIADSTPQQRTTIRKAFDAIEQVEAKNALARQYRSLMGKGDTQGHPFRGNQFVGGGGGGGGGGSGGGSGGSSSTIEAGDAALSAARSASNRSGSEESKSALQASRAALKASEEARDKDGHQKAREAHRMAAEENNTAAGAAEKKGNQEVARLHDEARSSHRRAASLHEAEVLKS